MVFSSQRGENLFGYHAVPPFLHGNFTQFDVPVPGEFMPANLDRPGDQVGLVKRLAGPAFCRASQRRFIAIPPSMAASLEPGRGTADRILGLRRVSTSHPAYERSAPRSQPSGDTHPLSTMFLSIHSSISLWISGLFPGLTEGREVLSGIPVEHQLVMHQRIGRAAGPAPSSETCIWAPAQTNPRMHRLRR